MSKLIDLTGQRFGRLVVLQRTASPYYYCKKAFWLCQCDCGKQHRVVSGSLRRGLTDSCGCLTSERLKAAALRVNQQRIRKRWPMNRSRTGGDTCR